MRQPKAKKKGERRQFPRMYRFETIDYAQLTASQKVRMTGKGAIWNNGRDWQRELKLKAKGSCL